MILATISASDWFIMIPLITTAAVTIIAALKSQQNGVKLDVAKDKLVEIHDLTNSNLAAVRAEGVALRESLAAANRRIEVLENFIPKQFATQTVDATASVTPPKPTNP